MTRRERKAERERGYRLARATMVVCRACQRPYPNLGAAFGHRLQVCSQVCYELMTAKVESK